MDKNFRLTAATVSSTGKPEIIKAVVITPDGKIVTDATFCLTHKCNHCDCHNDCSCEDHDPCRCEDDDHCYCDPQCNNDCKCYHYGGPG